MFSCINLKSRNFCSRVYFRTCTLFLSMCRKELIQYCYFYQSVLHTSVRPITSVVVTQICFATSGSCVSGQSGCDGTVPPGKCLAEKVLPVVLLRLWPTGETCSFAPRSWRHCRPLVIKIPTLTLLSLGSWQTTLVDILQSFPHVFWMRAACS